jgi:hypothetical protein
MRMAGTVAVRRNRVRGLNSVDLAESISGMFRLSTTSVRRFFAGHPRQRDAVLLHQRESADRRKADQKKTGSIGACHRRQPRYDLRTTSPHQKDHSGTFSVVRKPTLLSACNNRWRSSTPVSNQVLTAAEL